MPGIHFQTAILVVHWRLLRLCVQGELVRLRLSYPRLSRSVRNGMGGLFVAHGRPSAGLARAVPSAVLKRRPGDYVLELAVLSTFKPTNPQSEGREACGDQVIS